MSVVNEDEKHVTETALRALQTTGRVSITDVTTDNIRPAYAMPVLRKLAGQYGWSRRYEDGAGTHWVQDQLPAVHNLISGAEKMPEKIMTETRPHRPAVQVCFQNTRENTER